MRKKVAVFVQNMYGAMIADTQMGLREAALEKGVKLIFFSSFSDGFSSQFYNQYGKYDEGDIVSFKLPDLEDFDGVVILESSFPPVYIKRLEKLLLATDTPVINLGGVNDKFYSLITNVRDGKDGTLAYTNRKVTVEIGNGTIRRTFFHHRGTDDAFASGINDCARCLNLLRLNGNADEQEHCAQ